MLTLTPQQTQRMQPLAGKPAGSLLVHEVYRSIQGESTFAGLPCVFVRLSVCHLRCGWCDTPHAFKEGNLRKLGEVVAEVLGYDCPLVEITGGEPLLQDEVYPLMTRLAEGGKAVLLETSGAIDIGGVDPRVHIIMDLKCPDSGESEQNYWPNLAKLKPSDEIKFVVASRWDFDWAVEMTRSHQLDQRFEVLVSPAFGLVQPVDLAQWILETGLHVRMQLQLHKYVWDPQARGV